MISIIRTDEIKQALILYLKSLTTVTNKLVEYGSSVSEIRESEWKGTDFLYPAIRLRIIRNAPMGINCETSDISFAWQVITEDQSSYAADEIAGIIAPYFNNRQFSYNGIHFSMQVANLIPAIVHGDNAWRSEVLTEGFITRT